MIMKSPNKQLATSQKLLALSVLAAFGLAHADEDEIAQFTKPASSISVGLGDAIGNSLDRTIYGQYNGLRKDNASIILDLDLTGRNDTTGLWTIFQGKNLGLDDREMRFSQNKQGDWKYAVKYSELVHRDPRTINTGVLNSGTTTPTVVSLVTPGTGTDLNLDIKRKAISLDGGKWLTSNLLFEASAKNEDRNGARLSGTGITCGNTVISSIPCTATTGAMLMLPEPIDSTTKQIEFKLNYSGDKFMVSGGYYGSFFTNSNRYMTPTVSGNLVNPDGTTLDTSVSPGNTLAGYLQQPLALPPDNQAHQLYVSGSYAVTPSTHTNFKYAYTHATQHDDFGSLAGAPAGVSNLGAVLDSNLAQFGLTARPMDKLSMLGNLRYENKADKTPLALYNGAYTNDLNSSKRLTGKLEASYRLPDNLGATLGVDYATVHRDLPVSTAAVLNATLPPLSGLREDTKELGYRAELRRSMSETLNATVGYAHSKRDGGTWLNVDPYGTSGIYPSTMTDRSRDKVKLSAAWTPIDKLSLQFMLEDGKDTYTAPDDKGLRDTGMTSYGIDASLNLSRRWTLTGYVNRNSQTLHLDHLGYLAELEDTNTSLGFGVVGKPSSKLEMGGDLSYMNDSNRYLLNTGSGLPDVTYRVTTLKLYGKYAVKKNAGVRVDMVYQKAKIDKWTWGYNGTPFTYSDNTTVTMQPNQGVTFLGASYVYKFR
jgi:MtrB/PioB family decaheme-associated outer membrane protein